MGPRIGVSDRTHRALARVALVAFAAVLVMLLVGMASTSVALPAGRAWAVRETYKIPPGANTIPDRFVVDRDGSLLLFATTYDRFVGAELLRWEGAAWVRTEPLPYRPQFIWPVLSRTEDPYVIWQAVSEPSGYLVIARIHEGRLAELDTVTATRIGFAFSAAVTPRRRWAARGRSDKLDVFAADSGQAWRQIATDVAAYTGITIAPLTDTTALVVWASESPTRMYFAVTDGRTWAPAPIPNSEFAVLPRLRKDGLGRWLLTWANLGPDVRWSYYNNGQWSVPRSVSCAYQDADSVYSVKALDISYDDAPLPAMAWASESYRGGAASLCVSVPTGEDPVLGEGVVGGLDTWIPTIARDQWGDVWLAWAYERPFGFEGLYFDHTYTSVTSTAPSVVRRRHAYQLRWTLTGPAPGSHWTILRGHGRSEYAAVSNVSPVDDRVALSWVDEAPPRGQVRYRLRRECLDVRYQWLSPESRWPPRGRGPSLLMVASAAASSSLQVLDAAAGVVSLQVFDIQGRMVREARAEADALPVTLTIPHEGLGAGVYFVRATDGSGEQSEAMRIVVLR